jgi:hypothetical protein
MSYGPRVIGEAACEAEFLDIYWISGKLWPFGHAKIPSSRLHQQADFAHNLRRGDNSMSGHRVAPVVQADLSSYVECPWEDRATSLPDRRKMADLVIEGLNTLDKIQGNIEQWRLRVFRGELTFSADIEAALRNDLARWIEFTEKQVLPRVLMVEKVGGFNAIGNTAALRRGLLTAQRVLRDWKPAALSKAIGLRMSALNSDESAEVFASLRDKTARPKIQPRRFAADG